MSITKSYNKQTDTYYAYETTYEWSDEKQKKVQHKHCIGQYDPDTWEIIPNGKVGRPSKPKSQVKSTKRDVQKAQSLQQDDCLRISSKIESIEDRLQSLLDDIHDLSTDIQSLSALK